MTITTLTSRQFDHDAGKANNAAKSGPVFFTDRGRLAHVLLTFEDYRRLAGGCTKIADLLAMPGIEDSEMDTIDAALVLHPRARRLVVVTGASRPDRELEAGLRRNTERLRSRLTLEFLVGLPTDAVLKRLRQLGNDSVVFTPGHLEAART